ncbi:hypothetical protein D3Z50_08055 [Clostridiaceae bacterium]|nr:hypothetical protein [Clostridiaceae bacterium]
MSECRRYKSTSRMFINYAGKRMRKSWFLGYGNLLRTIDSSYGRKLGTLQKGRWEMADEDKIGKTFSKFYSEWLLGKFHNLPDDLQLKFYRGDSEKLCAIAQGRKKRWRDSRFIIDGTKSNGRLCFFSIKESRNPALKLFLTMIIKNMEKNIRDLLYMDEMEERIRQKGGKAACTDRLVKLLIGDLLNVKWLIMSFVEGVLEEKQLPKQEYLIHISAQKYEQRVVKTKMFFYSENSEAGEGNIIFDKNINREDRELSFDNMRTIRKMMEMSGEKHGLIVHGEEETYYIDGIRRVEEGECKNPLLCIEFNGHMKWSLKQGEDSFIEYCEGDFTIPALEGNKQDSEWVKELRCLKDVIPKLKEDDNAIHTVQGIINELKKQSHGTSIVFMDNKTLKDEIHRLGGHKRLYQMKEFNILEQTEEIIGISAIDGAILADIEGNCHAAGAILDGKSVLKGDSGRGARYNSIVNYVNGVYMDYVDKANKTENSSPESIWCFAVILSEDEIVSLGIPEELRKQFKEQI